MTRMVDENRLQMGTLKALGYSNFSIAGKYLFYAMLATILGSIVGMVVGFVVFPIIIWNAISWCSACPPSPCTSTEHGSCQCGHQRRRHRLCHMVRLPFQSGRKDRSFAAAPGSVAGKRILMERITRCGPGCPSPKRPPPATCSGIKSGSS